MWWPIVWPFWWVRIEWRFPYSSVPEEKGIVIYVDFKRKKKV